MTIYYVSTTGDDNNAGGPDGNALATIRKAVEKCKARGDEIHLYDGTHTDAGPDPIIVDKRLIIRAAPSNPNVIVKASFDIDLRRTEFQWIDFVQDPANFSGYAQITTRTGTCARLTDCNMYALTGATQPALYSEEGSTIQLRPANGPMEIDYSNVETLVIDIHSGRLWQMAWTSTNKVDVKGGKTTGDKTTIGIWDGGEILWASGTIQGVGQGVSGSRCIYLARGSVATIWGPPGTGNAVLKDAETGAYAALGSEGARQVSSVTLTNITTGFDNDSWSDWGEGALAPHDLGDHTDVDTSAASAGQYLKYDGTEWQGDTATVN